MRWVSGSCETRRSRLGKEKRERISFWSKGDGNAPDREQGERKRERDARERAEKRRTHLDDVTPSNLLCVPLNPLSVLPLVRRISLPTQQPMPDLVVLVNGSDVEPLEVPSQQHSHLSDILLLHVPPSWSRSFGGDGVLLDASSHRLGTREDGESDGDKLGRVEVSVVVPVREERRRGDREEERENGRKRAGVRVQLERRRSWKEGRRGGKDEPTRRKGSWEHDSNGVNCLPDTDEVALTGDLLDEYWSEPLGPQLLVDTEEVDLGALDEAGERKQEKKGRVSCPSTDKRKSIEDHLEQSLRERRSLDNSLERIEEERTKREGEIELTSSSLAG